MRRAELLERTGCGEKRFDTLMARGQLPFEWAGGQWSEYSEDDAARLRMMVRLIDLGLRVYAARRLALRSLEFCESLAKALEYAPEMALAEIPPGGAIPRVYVYSDDA